jgi:hypothetical protein
MPMPGNIAKKFGFEKLTGFLNHKRTKFDRKVCGRSTNYQHTFPWEISKIPKFNLTAENFPKTTHQDKE